MSTPCYSLFNRPPVIKTVGQSCVFNTTRRSPVRERFSNTVKRNESTRFSVISLLFWGFPSAITRLVVTLPIEPVKGCPKGSVTHVSNEVVEVKPPVTDSYFGPTVSWVGNVVLVSASVFHVVPRLVCWVRHSASTMRKAFLLCITSTRLCSSITQGTLLGSRFFTTFTNAAPQGYAVVSLSNSFNRSKPPMFNSGKVKHNDLQMVGVTSRLPNSPSYINQPRAL